MELMASWCWEVWIVLDTYCSKLYIGGKGTLLFIVASYYEGAIDFIFCLCYWFWVVEASYQNGFLLFSYIIQLTYFIISSRFWCWRRQLGRPLLQSKSMVHGDCFLYCTNFVCVDKYSGHSEYHFNIYWTSERLKPSQQMAKRIITYCIFSTLKEMIVSTVDSEIIKLSWIPISKLYRCFMLLNHQ